MRKFIQDLKIATRRLEIAKKRLKGYLNGEEMDNIKKYLTLSGDKELPPHPILDYSDTEKKIWKKIFGDPLKIPDNINRSISIQEFIQVINKRIERFREMAGFKKHTRISLYR